MDGIINIFKEQDFTSHDVVAKLRGILKTKKIGHTGTLDPKATGVLPVCVGRATKLCDYLVCEEKEYQAEITFGMTSDTEDIWGEVKMDDTPISFDEDQVRNVILSFIGSYLQIPPMYSAKKVNGKKLYELARQGIVIEREPVLVTIFSIRIISMDLPKVRFEVSCSKGTYIRTLCTDIGKALHCGAVMSELKRTRSGQFCIENAYTIEQVEEMMKQESVETYMETIEHVFENLPEFFCNERGEKALYNGNFLTIKMCENMVPENHAQERVRVYDTKKKFQAIYSFDRENQRYVPEKMFLERVE